MTYEPKPGTGWRKRQRPDGSPCYGLMLEPEEEAGPSLFVSVGLGDVFVISYSPTSFIYECPGLQHVQRVELDFAVQAWSVMGVEKAEGGYVAVLLRAVGVR